jgi:hypothetical protein
MKPARKLAWKTFDPMGWKVRGKTDGLVTCQQMSTKSYATFSEALGTSKRYNCKGIIDVTGEVCKISGNLNKSDTKGFKEPEKADNRICLQEMQPAGPTTKRCNMRPKARSIISDWQRIKYPTTIDECAAFVAASQGDDAGKDNFWTNDDLELLQIGDARFNRYPMRGYRYGKCQSNEFIYTPNSKMEMLCQCRSVEAKPNQKCQAIKIDKASWNNKNQVRSYIYTDTNLEVDNRCGFQNDNVVWSREGAKFPKYSRNPTMALSKFISDFATRMENLGKWDSSSATGEYYIHMNVNTFDAYVVSTCRNASGVYRNNLRQRNPNITVRLPNINQPRVVAEGAYRCSNGMYTLASHHKTPLACGLEVSMDNNCNKQQPIFSHGQFEGEYSCKCFPASKKFCQGYENHPKTDGQSIFKMYDLSPTTTIVKPVGRCTNTKVRFTVGKGYQRLSDCAMDVLKNENCAASVNYSNPLGDFSWGAAAADGTKSCVCHTDELDEHLGFNSKSQNGCNYRINKNPTWGLYRATYIANPNPITLTGHEACVDDSDVSINNNTDRIAAYFKAPKFCLHTEDDSTDNTKRDRCLMVQSFCSATAKKGTKTRGCAAMLGMSPCGEIGASCFVDNCLAFLDKLTFSETTRCKNEPLGKDFEFNGQKQGLINSVVNNGKNCIPVSRFFTNEEEVNNDQ